MIKANAVFNAEEFYNLRNRGIKLTLETTEQFLKLTGNPQNSFKSIHVAGSVGKGSTCAFIASILMEAGYKTGLYTSPHFVRFSERIKINGVEIEESYIAEFWITYSDYILTNNVTFFEATTVLAFCYFRDMHIDYAVVETGLGGRLDSTNLIMPLATVITAISLEHTSILGNSLEQIAREKGGIIKQNVPCFIGDLPYEAEEILKEICRTKNTKITEIKRNLAIYQEKYDFYSDSLILSDIVPPIKGKHQFFNSALAILTVQETLGLRDKLVFQHGINNVIKNTGFEGRFEIVSNSPLLILDSAHNPAGITAFVNEIKNQNIHKNNLSIIFSALTDKDSMDMLLQLKEITSSLYLYELPFERGMSADGMKKIAEQIGFKPQIINTFEDFINNVFQKADKTEAFAVTGSMYLLGSFKSALQKKKQIFI